MPKIETYFEKKRALDQLSKELQDLEESKELAREFEMIEKIKSIMTDYEVSASYLDGLLRQIDPSLEKQKGGGSQRTGKTGAKRRLMRFENPHTGEVVETRGGNHATLRQWRAEYGKDEVNSWKKVLE